MTATATAKRNRISLYKYIQGVAYMSGINLNKIRLGKNEPASKEIVRCPQTELKSGLLPLLSVKLNVSEQSLEQALSGESKPIDDLVTIATTIGAGQKLQNFLNGLPKPEIPMSATAQRRRKTRRRSRKSTKKPAKKVSPFRENLKNYIKALAKLRSMSLTDVAHQMDIPHRSVLNNDILRTKDETTIKRLQELPYVFHVDDPGEFNDGIESIMKGDTKPLKDLEKQTLSKVKGQYTLLRYLETMLILHDTNINEMSRALGKPSDFLRTKIMVNSNQEQIEPIFDRIGKILGEKPYDLQRALVKSNIRSSRHVYRNHMAFYVSYGMSPIGYKEPKHKLDRSITKINEGRFGLRNFWIKNRHSKYRIYRHYPRKSQDEKLQYGFQYKLRSCIFRLLSGYSFFYNFDLKEFLGKNFKNFYHDHEQMSVLVEKVWVPIKDNFDWMRLLGKVHYQLKTTRNAVNLGSVQQSRFAPFVNVRDQFDGELNDPLVHHYHIGLSHLKMDKEYTFIGTFHGTTLRKTKNEAKRHNNDFYLPALYLRNIKVLDKKTGNQHSVSNQIMVNYGKRFAELGKLRRGDVIHFHAHVAPVKVGEYTTHTVPTRDYAIRYPTPITVFYHPSRDKQAMPTDRKALTGYCYKANFGGMDLSNSNYQYVSHCVEAYNAWKKRQEKASTQNLMNLADKLNRHKN